MIASHANLGLGKPVNGLMSAKSYETMILGYYFDGDDDHETAVLQHDVYDQALGVIILECRNFYILANELTGAKKHVPAYKDLHVDHRTLQDAHDILAAVWRYRTDCVQPNLPFIEVTYRSFLGTNISPMKHWLGWLENEIQSWKTIPI